MWGAPKSPLCDWTSPASLWLTATAHCVSLGLRWCQCGHLTTSMVKKDLRAWGSPLLAIWVSLMIWRCRHLPSLMAGDCVAMITHEAVLYKCSLYSRWHQNYHASNVKEEDFTHAPFYSLSAEDSACVLEAWLHQVLCSRVQKTWDHQGPYLNRCCLMFSYRETRLFAKTQWLFLLFLLALSIFRSDYTLIVHHWLHACPPWVE